jgi:tetratricopeptide (TPR) repeat protein
LATFYQERGEYTLAEKLHDEWYKEYPELGMLTKARELRRQNNPRPAIKLLEQAKKRNATNWNVWALMGECYLLTGDFDSALACLRIGDGLNPMHPAIYNNMALAYFYFKDYDRAEELLLQTAEIDRNSLEPVMGLALLYQHQDRTADYMEYADKVIARPDAPLDFIRNLIDFYLTREDYTEASRVIRIGLTQGLDQESARELKRQYPQLGS